jgi:hypothetical protein
MVNQDRRKGEMKAKEEIEETLKNLNLS